MPQKEIINLLRQYTNHEHITLTARGNDAIMAALRCAQQRSSKNTVLIPDQGGWLTYREYPKKLGMNVEYVKTDAGMLDLDDLKAKIGTASCLLYANPAGYCAHQHIEEIYEMCKDNAMVILDVSGCIGDKELCNGAYADIVVGSFGRWKVVDAGHGGFISTNAKELFSTEEEFNFDEPDSEVVYEKLKNVTERLAELYKKCETIKKDLSGYDVIHRERKGIVVVVKFNNENECEELKQYCEQNTMPFTVCPRYIRVMEKALSIEVKRLP